MSSPSVKVQSLRRNVSSIILSYSYYNVIFDEIPIIHLQALQHILNGMQILCAREAVVAVLAPHGSAPGYGEMKKAAEAGNSNSASVTPAGTLTVEAAVEVCKSAHHCWTDFNRVALLHLQIHNC